MKTTILDTLTTFSNIELIAVCYEYSLDCIGLDRDEIINFIDSEIYLGNICFDDLKLSK